MNTVVMDRDHIWRAIDAQRSDLADLLDGLRDDQWRQPSLCEGWTVRDVAAHLTMQQLTPGDVVGTMLRWRGSLERTIQHEACRQAARLTPAQIVARIRETVGSRRHNLGVTYLETLTDCLVHGQDIAIPLGLRHDMPAQAAAVAASRVLSMRWPPPISSARTVKAFGLVATDTSWSHGDGPEVRGPMSALLLVSAGRLVALPRLAGPGVAELSARLGSTEVRS